MPKVKMSKGTFVQSKIVHRNFCPKKKCPKELLSKVKMSKGTFFQCKNAQRNFFPKYKCPKEFFSKVNMSRGTFFQSKNVQRNFCPKAKEELLDIFSNSALCEATLKETLWKHMVNTTILRNNSNELRF